MAKKKPGDVDTRQFENGLRVDLTTLANELRYKTEVRDRIASERGRISNELKTAEESLDATVAAIVAASRPGQMPLLAHEPDEAAADADDAGAEAGDVALSGVTGGPVDDEHYALEPSTENEGECVCGWALDATIPGHDRRHQQYLAATGEAPIPKVAKSKIDVTKAVSSRAKASTKKPPAKKKSARR